MKRILPGICSMLAILALYACGGGSGASIATPPPATAVVINSANAQSVAGRSVDVAMQTGSFGGLFGTSFLTPVASSGITKSLAAQSVSQALKSTISGTVISQVPVGPETTLCAVGGSLTVSGDIANPQTLTAGDSFNLDWNNCDDGLGQVIDGALGFSITSFSGDMVTGLFLLDMALTLNNFQVTEGANISSANGDISLSLDTRTSPISVASTSGNNFTVSNNGSTETLSNFSSVVTENASMFPSSFSATSMGTISSTQFSGTVTYSTPVAFESIGAAYPFAGELLVTGANNATLRVIALDEVNVRIEADYDGDGAVDETIDTTWDVLVNS